MPLFGKKKEPEKKLKGRFMTIRCFWNEKSMFNPSEHDFGPIYQSALRGGKTNFLDFFFIGASATKMFPRSRIFRYGLPQDILNKREKSREGGAYSAPSLCALKG